MEWSGMKGLEKPVDSTPMSSIIDMTRLGLVGPKCTSSSSLFLI